MVLSEPEGLLRIAIADLESAEASSDPALFRESAWGFWLQLAVKDAHRRIFLASWRSRSSCCWRSGEAVNPNRG
jgi:hypothetical protein